MTPSSPHWGSGWTMMNAEDTVLSPSPGPMQCSAARTVSAVVLTAPQKCGELLAAGIGGRIRHIHSARFEIVVLWAPLGAGANHGHRKRSPRRQIRGRLDHSRIVSFCERHPAADRRGTGLEFVKKFHRPLPERHCTPAVSGSGTFC